MYVYIYIYRERERNKYNSHCRLQQAVVAGLAAARGPDEHEAVAHADGVDQLHHLDIDIDVDIDTDTYIYIYIYIYTHTYRLILIIIPNSNYNNTLMTKFSVSCIFCSLPQASMMGVRFPYSTWGRSVVGNRSRIMFSKSGRSSSRARA